MTGAAHRAHSPGAEAAPHGSAGPLLLHTTQQHLCYVWLYVHVYYQPRRILPLPADKERLTHCQYPLLSPLISRAASFHTRAASSAVSYSPTRINCSSSSQQERHVSTPQAMTGQRRSLLAAPQAALPATPPQAHYCCRYGVGTPRPNSHLMHINLPTPHTPHNKLTLLACENCALQPCSLRLDLYTPTNCGFRREKPSGAPPDPALPMVAPAPAA